MQLHHAFPQFVRVITQYVGSIVYVPPRWMHTVFTVQKCDKLSWELVNPMHFLDYSKVWSEQMRTLPDPPKDFVGFMNVAVGYLTSGKWSRVRLDATFLFFILIHSKFSPILPEGAI